MDPLQQTSHLLHPEIQATCSSLGFTERGKYVKEPDCEAALSDLIRFLRHEDSNCSVRRQLGYAQVVMMDLLPLLVNYSDQDKLFDTALRLLLNLTQPVGLCWATRSNEPREEAIEDDMEGQSRGRRKQIPADPVTAKCVLEVDRYLHQYKNALAVDVLWGLMAEKLTNLLGITERSEEQQHQVGRILMLVRNLLNAGPEIPDDHDRLICSLHSSGMLDLVLYLASAPHERQLLRSLLEIIALIFREQDVSELARVTDVAAEKKREERELIQARVSEEIIAQSRQRSSATRHSKFGGTYVMRGLPGASNDMVFHRGRVEEVRETLEHLKTRRKRSQVAPLQSVVERKSALSVRLALKDVATRLLDSAYNGLMSAARSQLRDSSDETSYDKTYFFSILTFFMSFNRHTRGGSVSLVSETINNATFDFVNTAITETTEHLFMLKREVAPCILWTNRLVVQLKAFSELLTNLAAMVLSSDTTLQSAASSIANYIFYIPEYRNLLPGLFAVNRLQSFSRNFLPALVATTHIWLRVFERICATGVTVCREKKKKQRRRQKAKSRDVSTELLDANWDEVSEDVSAFCLGLLLVAVEETATFDPLLEESEQQKLVNLGRVQAALRSGEPEQAIAIFRAARSLWPDLEFGSDDTDPAEEFMLLREIFFAGGLPLQEAPSSASEADNEEEESADQVVEENLTFSAYFSKYSNKKILYPYMLLFEGWLSNSATTNHHIIKMFQRLCVQQNLPAMCFQLRLFATINKMFANPLCKEKQFQEVYGFSRYITKLFFTKLPDNPLLVAELLFLKAPKQAEDAAEKYSRFRAAEEEDAAAKEEDAKMRQLTEEYQNISQPSVSLVAWVTTQLGETRDARFVQRRLAFLDLTHPAAEWSRQEEDLVRRIVQEFRESNGSSALHDIVDKVHEMFPEKPAKLIKVKLIELEMCSLDELRHAKADVWTTELEEKLRFLFERHSADKHRLQLIKDDIGIEVGKKVIAKKCFELGLVDDAKAMYKNRLGNLWTPALIERLRDLFAQYRADKNRLQLIKGDLDVAIGKKALANKCAELGLVEEAGMMYKSRPRTKSTHKTKKSADSSDREARNGSDSGSGSDDEAAGAGPTGDQSSSDESELMIADDVSAVASPVASDASGRSNGDYEPAETCTPIASDIFDVPRPRLARMEDFSDDDVLAANPSVNSDVENEQPECDTNVQQEVSEDEIVVTKKSNRLVDSDDEVSPPRIKKSRVRIESDSD